MGIEYGEYVNGFVERKHSGVYEGVLRVDGVDISPIQGVYFTNNDTNNKCLWLKRKPIMEYDIESQAYRTRKRKPDFECYLEKQVSTNTVAYKGTFTFFRFRYSIVGVWDAVLGKDRQRLNLFVERLPMQEQTILKGINERNKKNAEQ